MIIGLESVDKEMYKTQHGYILAYPSSDMKLRDWFGQAGFWARRWERELNLESPREDINLEVFGVNVSTLTWLQ